MAEAGGEEKRKTELKGLSAALDNTGICTFMYFPKTKMITIPEKARRIYQCRETYIDMPYSFADDFVYQGDKAQFNEMYFKIDSGIQTATAIFRNHELTAQCHVTLTTVISDREGRPEEVLGIIENESIEMKRTIELNRMVVALSDDCFSVLSVDFSNNKIQLLRAMDGAILSLVHFFETEPTYLQFIEYCAENLVVPDEREKFIAKFDAQRIREQLCEHNSAIIRYTRTYKDDVHHIEARFVDISTFHDGSSAVLAYRYIDDLVIMEEKERQHNAVFHSLGNIYDSIYLLDFQTGTYREITAVDALRRYFKPEGRLEKGWNVICRVLVSEEYREQIENFLDIGTIAKRMRRKNLLSVDFLGAATGWNRLMIIANERDPDGNIRNVLLVTRGINEEKKKEAAYQEELKKAAYEATQANRAKTEFLSRISHDMRTPLNGIIGMSHIARGKNQSEQIEDCLEKIDTSSKFLLGLINDILDLVKAESSKLVLHPEPYPPNEFTAYMEAVIMPLIHEKHQVIDFQVHLPQGVIPMLDKLRINQIVFNILSNAVKFTPEGGTIRYMATGTTVSEEKMQLHIEITDNGIGMSKEFQKQIFEPFSQENRNDVSASRGSGLGMAIAKQLIDLMGGTIAVESSPGLGSIFTIDLLQDTVSADWIGEQNRKTDIDLLRPEKSLAGKHILLCEDHPLNQEIAKALLTEKEMLVEIAEDGQKGTSAFLRSAVGYYDAILMDIRMPVMDGYEAAKAIRSMERTDAKTIPIIAMTADAFAEDVKRCLDAGMNAHVAKPIDPTALYDVLGQYI